LDKICVQLAVKLLCLKNGNYFKLYLLRDSAHKSMIKDQLSWESVRILGDMNCDAVKKGLGDE